MPGQVITFAVLLNTARVASVQRATKETKVDVSINLDGTGVSNSHSQIPFLDHMIDVSMPPALCHPV